MLLPASAFEHIQPVINFFVLSMLNRGGVVVYYIWYMCMVFVVLVRVGSAYVVNVYEFCISTQ